MSAIKMADSDLRSFHIEEAEYGLWFVTSPKDTDLFIAATSFDRALEALKCIKGRPRIPSESQVDIHFTEIPSFIEPKSGVFYTVVGPYNGANDKTELQDDILTVVRRFNGLPDPK